MTQTEMVLKYMRERGGITQAEAVRDLGCYRLGARIWDLKHEGHRILAVTKEAENRFGRIARFSEYRLVDR